MNISSIKVPADFNPVKIVITCETLDELRVLWVMANAPDSALLNQSKMAGFPKIKAAIMDLAGDRNGANYQLFRLINAALVEAGGKD